MVIRHLFAKFWMAFAILTILLAVFMTIARLALPLAGDYRKEIEDLISASIGQPVEIGKLESRWHGLGPSLDIVDVKVFDNQHDRLLVRLKRARIGLDLFASLLRGQFELGNLTMVGADISVSRLEDGRLSVQGMSLTRDGNSSRENNRLLQWLFSQGNISIESAEVIWHDLTDGQQLRFTSVNLELRNEGSRHQLDGSASLPLSLGRRIAFAIDLKGDPLLPGGWDGRAYINGGGLHLDSLLKGQEIAGMRVNGGVAEVRLWSDWVKARPVKLEGTLSAFALALTPVASGVANQPGNEQHKAGYASQSYLVDTLSGKFAWQKQQDGWSLAVNDFILSRDGRLWPSGEFDLGIRGHDWEQHILAKASYLNVDDIRDLYLSTNQPDPQVRTALLSMRPRGDLHDTYVDVQMGGGNDMNINITSRFANVAVDSWGKIPGIEGLAGTLKGSGQSGSIEFSSSAVQLVYMPMFRQPISINELGGEITWQHEPGLMRLASDRLKISNDDLQADAAMNIEISDASPSPYIGLDVRFSGTPGSVEHTSRYLPVTVIPHATQWLDQAIIGGTISDGKFIFDGRVDQFPFDHNSGTGKTQSEGKFEVRFNVTNGILDYAEGWPRLEEIEAEVHFLGSSLEINAVAAKSLDAEITTVQARIADLHKKPAELEIHGKAIGPTRDVLRYINESPLAEKFGPYLGSANASGDSQLELKLERSLAKGEPVIVAGDLILKDSALQLPDSKVDISAINGELEFTDSTLTAHNISARIMGIRSTVEVATRQEQQISATYITAQGMVDEASISRLLDIPGQQIVKGDTSWSARLRVPKVADQQPVVSTLHVESDLKGLTIALPAPLGKTKDESRRLVVETGLPRSLDKLVELSLGDVLSANLDVDEQMHIERGAIHLGRGIAPFPDNDGLYISGDWPGISLDDWLPVITSEKLPQAPPTTTVVNDVDIGVGQMKAFARVFHRVKIHAQKMAQAWGVYINSKEMKGDIQLPFDPDATLVMDLDYLHLAKVKSSQAKDRMDPRKIPVMKIKSKVFTYNDMDFGSLDLTASRHPAGIHLDSLRLTSPTDSVDARGDWLTVNGEHYSSFNITFTSQDLGDTLAKWGYAGSISKGKTTFDIVARWQGPPTEFALERLDGNLHLKITDGRVLEIDPGAGRIFGLISLQALPRRLSLDFSDMFRKGFSFDKIEGDFILKGGVATTENLVMEGPAARLEAQGKIGLSARNYDQVVTVTPNVSSSLPVAGAVVGGMGVGAAILLAQQLLEPEIDKAARVKYSVTGQWDDPVIKRLNVKKPDARDNKSSHK